MNLDLMELKRMHPLLPAVTAAEYGHRAALGLERHRHEPGVVLKTVLDREQGRAELLWVRFPTGDAEQLDRHRITEDAAEAIALALVHGVHGWVVRRRLQRGEAADWLLHDAQAQPVALEVSGIAEGHDPQRLKQKLEQVRGATAASRRAACVVELPVPRATVATV